MSTISVSGRSGAHRNRKRRQNKQETEKTVLALTFEVPTLLLQQTIFTQLSTIRQKVADLKWEFSFSKENRILGKVESADYSALLEVLSFLQRENVLPRLGEGFVTSSVKGEEDQLQQIACGTVTGSTWTPKEPSCLEEFKEESGAFHHHHVVNFPQGGQGSTTAFLRSKERAHSAVGYLDSPSSSEKDLSEDENDYDGSDDDSRSLHSNHSLHKDVLSLLDKHHLLLTQLNHHTDNLRFSTRKPPTKNDHKKCQQPASEHLLSLDLQNRTIPQLDSINYPTPTLAPILPNIPYFHHLPFMYMFPQIFESLQDRDNGEDTKGGNIVYVKGIEKSKLSIQQICNLFECFGDVEIGMLHTKKEYAMIKFSSFIGARNCIKELYGKEIGGKNLLLHFSELETLVPKFYTNEKVYHIPKSELKENQAPKRSNHISKTLVVNFCPIGVQNGIQEKILTVVEAKKLVSTKIGQASIRPDVAPNQFFLDFNCTKTAVEFVMNNNYTEFHEVDLFAMYTFAPRTRQF